MQLNAKYGRLVGIVGMIVVADQITKALILHYVALYDAIPVIPGFFSITHIHNPGGAFGLLADGHSGLRQGLFFVASLAAVVLVVYYFVKMPANFPWLSAGFAMILGGAVGNLVDRVRMGAVVDFIDFYVGNLHWPAFNVADSAITIGVVIILYHLLIRKVPI
jgi:signal peptidase II